MCFLASQIHRQSCGLAVFRAEAGWIFRATIWANVQQSVELLKARIFDKQGRDPILTQLNRAIERVKTEGELLRKLLRSHPNWGLGHVRLGLWELKLHELCDRP